MISCLSRLDVRSMSDTLDRSLMVASNTEIEVNAQWLEDKQGV